MLTIAEVAQRYGVSGQTVRRWCMTGLLSGAVKLGKDRRGTWVIPASALEGFEPPKRNRK
jgi:predicted site-specific integrase-resolvase